MKTIKITCTGIKKEYPNPYFKPYVCTSDIDLPKMYNQGYNSFRFEGGEPNFIGVNMPLELKRETQNFKMFEVQIEVLRKNNSRVIGSYHVTENKITGEKNETFSFF